MPLVSNFQFFLSFSQLFLQTFFVMLEALAFLLELGFDREDFFLFAGQLASDLLDLVLQLLLQLDDALFAAL